MLNSKQRAFLRSRANSIQPIFQVGKGSVSDAMCRSVGDALEARELVKISVLLNAADTARDVADRLAEDTGADVVAVIGRKIILYRPSSKEKNRTVSPEVAKIRPGKTE
ncbi:MAG: ribosome assembly RNA-binding protein YhbY [Clostridia bacterium]|nr:ribosome assembly RNA-binding protein YhbY [Clostridia bacterium]MBR6290392.1 ribosome assembly RNA-binding protein YhbY [Clostridia bacterium]